MIASPFRVAAVALILLAAGAVCTREPAFAREPLPYRIVSFHQGRADKALIRRAAELGYNGVQFQLEGSTVKSLTEFAERNKTEGYIDLCHSLGMKVTLWVHELSDIAGPDQPGYLGPIELGNDKLWNYLDKRYEWLFGELVPDIDGIALTVVETQIDATDTPMMVKLVGILRDKCRKYGKDLIVRTFVHHPEQLQGVMGCVKQLPEDVIIMTKCVPQDWQMRGINNKAIGHVGDHRQIIEFDIDGEYFLLDQVANCFPDLLKEQIDYGVANGADGVCVRVDRWDTEVLHEPQEVNLWALGMFSAGKTDSVDDVWDAWATARYGRDAAPGVIKALKPTREVVTECLNIGPFTYGDTRSFPPNGDNDVFARNWQNWRWDPSYGALYQIGLKGDRLYTRKLERQKREAATLAQQSLDDLEQVKDRLAPEDYDILRTKLMGNQVQLAYRAPMMLAYMRYRRILNTGDQAEKTQLAAQIREDLKPIRDVGQMRFAPAREIEYMGRKWKVDAPAGVDQKRILQWADKMETLLAEQGL